MAEAATGTASGGHRKALHAGRAVVWVKAHPPRFIPTVPLGVIVGMALVAIFAPAIAPHDPLKQSLLDNMRPPAFVSGGSSANLLGTDIFGRDILSRLVFGARISLGVGALVIAAGAFLGTLVAVVAGYFGGAVDALLMRIVDMFLSLPIILVAIVLVVVLGTSTLNVLLVVTLLIWPRFARVIRSEVLALREQDFVTLARIAGASDLRIMGRHILPNAVPTLVVISTLQVGQVIIMESSLSFLGVGIPPPLPSWGSMVTDGRAQLASGWWISLFPGLAILLVVLALNSIGDWLRDRLDPRLSEY